MLPEVPCKTAVIGGFGLMMTLSGALLSFLWPSILDFIISREMLISPTSSAFELWRGTAVPLYIEFYLFNWTNHEELREPGSKPNLVEMGPYRFQEFHEKVNITWNANKTVTYKQIRYWHFDPENSNGTLSDQVTTLNPVPLAASYTSRHWSFFVQKSMSMTFSSTGEKIQVTKSVGELLFEGYNDPILSMGSKLPMFGKMKIPYDKFGWFYLRNGSADYDGVFNMATGQGDISSLGELLQWNYANRTDFYSDHCGQINGSAGELWPPGRTKTQSIAMYSPDLCRSIHFDFTEESTVEGVPGYCYSGGPGIVDNGTSDPSNECFCGGQCVPSGALNVSMCRFGAPGFVSYPHFYQADPYYLRQVDGLCPDKEKHRFYVTLEPKTGIPLDIAARFQINLLLQSYPGVGIYKDVPTIIFPMLWFQARGSMTSELATSLRLLLQLPTWGLTASLGLMMAGLLILMVIVMLHLYRNNKLHPVNRVDPLEKYTAQNMKKDTCNSLLLARKCPDREMQAMDAVPLTSNGDTGKPQCQQMDAASPTSNGDTRKLQCHMSPT